MRVLIIDDDRDFADSLAELLRLDQHHVELAFSGDMGVELFKATPFNSVFVDIMLGDQDGLEVLRELKPRNPNTNFWVISGRSADQFADRAIRLGATAILQKPFSSDEITEIREQLLSQLK